MTNVLTGPAVGNRSGNAFEGFDDSRKLPILEPNQCASLVAKVVIADDHRFTQAEIELARELGEYEWNPNLTDFLYGVAGIMRPGEFVGEAYAALVCSPASLRTRSGQSL